VRGHIRLEHEMKLHMDYLEQKVEDFEREQVRWDQERRQFAKKAQVVEEQLKAAQAEAEKRVANVKA